MSEMASRRSEAQLRDDAQAIWRAGVEAVRGDRLVRDAVRIEGPTLWLVEDAFRLSEIERMVVVGAGKAGGAMARGFEEALGGAWSRKLGLTGVVNVPADCVGNLEFVELCAARPAGVNEPTLEGVAGARRMLEMVSGLGPRDLAVCLLSGGASALLPLPRAGITLGQKLAVTRFLASRGANIHELNTVRKQLSAIKGGRLAAACRAGALVSLILSDVMGDPLDVIGSGPTVADPSRPEEALEILERFGAPSETWFPPVREVLRQAEGETRPRARCAATWHVIGNNAVAVDAAGVEAERRGYSHAMTSSRVLEGEADALGAKLASLAVSMRSGPGPDCLISGGEPVVRWQGKGARGKGGRNQQLALAALVELARRPVAEGVVLLSGGTDGEDGPTDAAGAMVDGSLARHARGAMAEVEEALVRQDSYAFFSRHGGLLKTGPTETNVGDVRVIVVDRVESAGGRQGA